MGARYMTFEEYLKEEREEAREEGRQEGERNKLINQVKKKLAALENRKDTSWS